MRINLIPTWIVVPVLLFTGKAIGQVNESVKGHLTDFSSPFSRDTSAPDRLLPNFSPIIPNGVNASGQLKTALNNQLVLPIDTRQPLLTVGNASVAARVNNTSNIAGHNGMTGAMHGEEMGAGISLWNIPFIFGYNSNSGWQHDANERLAFGSSRFDRDKFLEQVKERLQRTTDPEKLFQGALTQLYARRDQAFASWQSDLTGMLRSANPALLQQVQDRLSVENISRQGVEQFLQAMTAEQLRLIGNKQEQLQQLQAGANSPFAIADSVRILNQELADLTRAKEEVDGKLLSLREKWSGNGVLETIGGFEKEKKAKLDQLMSDPAALARAAEQHLSLRGLQKLLLNAKSLNIGSVSVKQSRLGLNDALLKGVSMEMLKGKKFFSPVLGSQPGIRNLSDLSYANFSELNDVLTGALRMGKGDMQKDFSHISLSLFQQYGNRFLPGGMGGNSAAKNLVTTFSKRISIGGAHTVLTEISKSTMLYSAASGGAADGLKNVLNTGNLLSNMGITLDYAAELEKLGVSERLVVRYTGKEYNNLGNFSLVSGTKEISNDLRKYLLKRKLIVQLKAQFREYEFAVDDRKWRSFSYLTDIKWKLKKGEFVELRYQPYTNHRITAEQSQLSSRSHRLALRGNVNRKIARGLAYRNFMELASSRDGFYDPLQDKLHATGFISFTSLQTLAVGKQTLFVNVTGNHARQNTGYLFSNSSVSVDGGMTYNLGRQLSLSTALVYNEVNSLYGQLAIRQSLSTMLGKKIMLEGFLHAGKNLYEQAYLNIPAVTGNLSVTYNLK